MVQASRSTFSSSCTLREPGPLRRVAFLCQCSLAPSQSVRHCWKKMMRCMRATLRFSSMIATDRSFTCRRSTITSRSASYRTVHLLFISYSSYTLTLQDLIETLAAALPGSSKQVWLCSKLGRLAVHGLTAHFPSKYYTCQPARLKYLACA